MGEVPRLSRDRPPGVFRHVTHPILRHLRLAFTPSGFCFFLLRPDAARTVQPALLPFTPQFSPFAAYYLTYPYWHAILSRAYRSSSSPKRRPCALFSHSLRVADPPLP